MRSELLLTSENCSDFINYLRLWLLTPKWRLIRLWIIPNPWPHTHFKNMWKIIDFWHENDGFLKWVKSLGRIVKHGVDRYFGLSPLARKYPQNKSGSACLNFELKRGGFWGGYGGSFFVLLITTLGSIIQSSWSWGNWLKFSLARRQLDDISQQGHYPLFKCG